MRDAVACAASTSHDHLVPVSSITLASGSTHVPPLLKARSFLAHTALLSKDELFRSPGDKPYWWRLQHNYFLDHGTKFALAYKDPMITWTNLFDLKKFGCYDREDFGKAFANKFRKLSKILDIENEGKRWWIHPSFQFGTTFERVGVHLQDETTGEVRWDAIYDLSKKGPSYYPDSKKFGKESLISRAGGNTLTGDELPVGGAHPFFPARLVPCGK